MSEQTDTPRVDAVVLSHIKSEATHDDWLARLNDMIPLAKTLERDLNEAVAAIQHLRVCGSCAEDDLNQCEAGREIEALLERLGVKVL